MARLYRRQSSLGSARTGSAEGSFRRTGRAFGGGGGRSWSAGSVAGSPLDARRRSPACSGRRTTVRSVGPLTDRSRLCAL